MTTRAKSRLRPHLFVPDLDVPPGQDGRGACGTCHLIGEAGDAHHALPDVPEMAEHLRRYEGGIR